MTRFLTALALPCFSLALAATSARADATAPAPNFEIDKGALVLPGVVAFETAADRVKADSEPVLQHVKAFLDAKPYITLLRIEVHTDSQGDDAYNQKMSETRALATARWLVAHGAACARLLPVGFGETKPIAPNDSVENRAKNRRVSFIMAAMRGRPIGGMPVDGGGRVAGDPCK